MGESKIRVCNFGAKQLAKISNVLLAITLLAAAFAAFAQQYPTKPVRYIVPFPAAASPDLVARPIAERLSRMWGQQVVVDNRAGAGGTVGAAKAGTYGSLTLNADGSYSYVANNANALAAGQTATDTFTYTVRDAAGATSTATGSSPRSRTGASPPPSARGICSGA